MVPRINFMVCMMDEIVRRSSNVSICSALSLSSKVGVCSAARVALCKQRSNRRSLSLSIYGHNDHLNDAYSATGKMYTVIIFDQQIKR